MHLQLPNPTEPKAPAPPEDAIPKKAQASRTERLALGKSLRESCPRASHGVWKPEPDRAHPLHLVRQADSGRLPELLPLRHGRMALSPFTFYRGSALAMAADLANTPATGIRVQCGGDSHLANFGGYATPERQVIFAINDLDETLPGPWEWDIKRLAASFEMASRDNGLGEPAGRDAVLTCVRSYREHMAKFSEMGVMDLWYQTLEAESLIAGIKDAAFRRRAIRRLTRSRETGTMEALYPKLVGQAGAAPVFKDQPPGIFHWPDHAPGEIHPDVSDAFGRYRTTLLPAHQLLLDRFELRDAAIKVVGVGSVGTSCWMVLLTDAEGEPLILQVKEARASVLEAYAGPSRFANHGQRVVNGHRLMQPTSDIFLGWTEGRLGRHFYLRQLRDVKIKIAVETFGPSEMIMYAQWCGHALALSHARSGDPAIISGYLGKRDSFDKALYAFSIAYADQSERDHAVLHRAIQEGEVEAEFESIP